MVDGLGHGEQAEVAGKAAVEYVTKHLDDPLVEILEGCNKAIHHTRGVAMGLASVDDSAGTMQFAGVGNTRARLISVATGKSYFLASTYGIVGGGFRSVTAENVDLSPGDLFLMYTDGLKEMFDISCYPSLRTVDVQELADTMLADWKRKSDDGAILVCRQG